MFTSFATICHQLLNLFVFIRMQILEPKVFQFPFDLTQAESVCQGGVYLESLFSNFSLLAWHHVIEGPHVVQPVGQLHKNYSHILSNGNDQLAKVLSLTFFFRAEAELS